MLNQTMPSPVLPRGGLSPDPLGGEAAIPSLCGGFPPPVPLHIPHRVHPCTLLRREEEPGPGPPHALSRLTPGRDPPESPPSAAPPAPAPAPARQQRALGERHCVGPGEGGDSALPPPAPAPWLRGTMRARPGRQRPGSGCRVPSAFLRASHGRRHLSALGVAWVLSCGHRLTPKRCEGLRGKDRLRGKRQVPRAPKDKLRFPRGPWVGSEGVGNGSECPHRQVGQGAVLLQGPTCLRGAAHFQLV